MKLWAGQAISEMGSTVTREALPLTAALVLGATPLQMGLLAAASSLPVLLVGLIAGVWVDRLRRRPLMIGADLGRALLLLTIPLAAAWGRLSLVQLCIVLPLAGVLSVVFDAAYQSFVPALVRRDELVEANSKLGMGAAGAEVVAPGLAGVLVQTIGGPSAVLLDAASFLWSALLVRLIRGTEPPPAPPEHRQSMGREIAAGLRAIRHSPLLRAFAGASVTASFFGNFFAGLYTLYALRVLGLGPAVLGLCVACGGAGSLVGAVVAAPLARRLGVGYTVLWAAACGGLIGLLIPLAGGPPLVAAALLMATQLFGDAADTVAGITQLSLRQASTPPVLRGRVNAGMNLLAQGVGPLGALTGGALAGAIGIRQTLAVAVAGSLLGLPWLIFSPLRDYHDLPPEG
jgi:predicted MFS family arabinose efflux permease